MTGGQANLFDANEIPTTRFVEDLKVFFDEELSGTLQRLATDGHLANAASDDADLWPALVGACRRAEVPERSMAQVMRVVDFLLNRMGPRGVAATAAEQALLKLIPAGGKPSDGAAALIRVLAALSPAHVLASRRSESVEVANAMVSEFRVAVGLRGVFENEEIDHPLDLVPIVSLEIESVLKDHRRTHAYALTRELLEKLISTLGTAKRRLKALETRNLRSGDPS